MTKNLISVAAIVCAISANAQKPVFTQAKIESARVYTNGAELKHKASAQIQAGTSEIVITNVANYLNESTVQISVPKHVTVMSVQYSNSYVEEYDNNSDSPLVKPVKEALESKEKELKSLQNQLTAERKSVELLDKNQSMSQAQNFSVAELSKLLEYYKTKRSELSNNIHALERKEVALKEEIKSLKGKLSFSNTTSEKISQGKLILNVMSNQAGNISINISYLTTQARWQPSYELRIDQINSPIQAVYKAQVQQSTGLDWKNVNLSLTSGAANQNTYAPQLHPWFVSYNQPYTEGIVIDSYRTLAKSANTSYVETASYKAVEPAYADDYEESLGSTTIDDFVATDESQLNLTYNIDIPYTILSNNKAHSVSLKNQNIPAEYQYISIPKYDSSVYLVAKVKDYAKYDLLSGEATVIFENAYVGKTYINPTSEEEGLTLSLGKDNNIMISRKKVNDKSGTKMLSSRKQQDFVYEISVRNNKKSNIDIEIQDQYPLSSDKDIEIILNDKDDATVNTETGKLTWNLKVKPNETKKVRMSYQLKYAKDKQINI